MSETLSQPARACLHWALTDGVGPRLFQRIVERFGSPEAALGASASALAELRGVGREGAERIARQRDQVRVETEIEAAAEAGVRILCSADSDWPVGLRQIPDPPIVLYVLGDLRPTDAIAVAVVGTRRCSIYGGEQARRFGELLAGVGFTIVSGLARGIDAFAHHGAVDVGGRSIAVLGSGLNHIYPPENEALAHRLLKNGAWISELPMRTRVRREHFPGRNRILAGMTLGTLVVEAPRRSGALITARLASEYNREVFAIPGRIDEPAAFGTNALIRDGAAKLVTCLDDILDELGEVGERLRAHAHEQDKVKVKASSGSQTAGASGPPLSDTERAVYVAVGREPVYADTLLQHLGLPAGDVLAAVTALELKGLIKRLPGQRLVRRNT